MRKFLLVFLLGLMALPGFGQRQFQDQSWNFGDVAFWNNDTAWFTIENPTKANLVFLPTFYNQQFRILLSQRSVEPGGVMRLGIVYYSENSGKFAVDVPVYVNQKPDPIVFHLKGNIKSFDPMAELRCPNMNGEVTENKFEKIIAVEVRDLETDVLLQPDGLAVKTRDNKKVSLEKDGLEFKMRVSPGDFKVYANKLGYNEYYAAITLEPYQSRFIVYLEKLPIDEPPDAEIPLDTGSMVITTEEEPDLMPEPPPLIEIPEVHTHPERDSTPAEAPIETPGGGLDRNEYALNNVIMIVDVSSSMNRGGKIQGLRSSFNILVDALRPEDRIAIISMSSNAVIVQPSTGVYIKDSLKARLAGIKPQGSTNGGAAIQLAYKLARENFVPNGNNQVIIATDGIFYGGGISRRDMEAMIVQANADGIHMSTVAFGSDPKAVMFLESLAQKGGGSFVQVTGNDQDETRLLEMIKAQSKRK